MGTVEAACPAVVAIRAVRVRLSLTAASLPRTLTRVHGDRFDELRLGGGEEGLGRCELGGQCLNAGREGDHGGTVCCSRCGELGDGVGSGILEFKIIDSKMCAGGGRVAFPPFLVGLCKFDLKIYPSFLVKGEALPFPAIVNKNSCPENKGEGSVRGLDGGDWCTAMVSVGDRVLYLLKKRFDG